MGRHHSEQRQPSHVRKEKTSKEKEKDKDKDKDKHLLTPKKGRKRDASRSPSLVSPRKPPSIPDDDMPESSPVVPPPSKPSLENLDSKLDKVIQLQLSAQTRIADLERLFASHETALRELGPLNVCMATLTQRMDKIDDRLSLVEAGSGVANPSASSVRPYVTPSW